MSETPELSVVVALVSARVDDLRHCLTALHDQDTPQRREILVPYDEAAKPVLALAAEFPDVQFIPADRGRTIVQRGGLVREHHDSLRTVGIRHARAPVVALTEDHAHVSRNWCSALVAALERNPRAAAVGGAVDCDSDSPVNWAVYFGDFGRYQSPVQAGPAEYVSDANVAYRAEALNAVGDGWESDYHETIVHWGLARAGYQLILTPEPLVWQRRGKLGFGASLLERFVWGKSFAGGRCHDMSLPKRAIIALLSPVIPFLFSWRGWRLASSRGRGGRFLTVLPTFFLLQCCWAAGELAGYVTGKP